MVGPDPLLTTSATHDDKAHKILILSNDQENKAIYEPEKLDPYYYTIKNKMKTIHF